MLLLSFFVAIAQAQSSFEVGISPYASFDLPDSNRDSATWGPAWGVRLPARWWFHSKIALRGQIDFGGRSGKDTIYWDDYAGTLLLYSDEHNSSLRSWGMLLGPELNIFEHDIFQLRGGVHFGGWHFKHEQDYDDSMASPLRPLDTNIYGSLLQSTDELWSAVMLTQVSGTIFLSPVLAFQAEFGYCTSNIEENYLNGPDPKRNAYRTGYGLNEIQFGLAISYQLGANQ